MIRAKQELLQALGDAIAQVAPNAAVTPAFENPKQAAHGDFAITLAMQLARAHKRNPRELAAALVEALQAQPAVQRWVSALEIAGPGFINLRLSAAARQAIVAEVLAAGDEFGRRPATGQRVMVEFVSANPTGPLHVGHGRNAALGDCISSLLQSQGAEVLREFYYNDAGVQIHTLAVSTQCRLKGLKPGDAGWPEQAYNGEYIADIAAGFAARQTVKADDRSFTASGDPDDLDGIRQFAVAWLRHEQDLDLQAFGVHFDHYFLESSLYTDGRVEDTVQRLVAAGKTFEEGGALWLRSTEYGDDKDRVMRKSDGTYTYFVPDVAYHINKFQRGYTQVINVQGTDHHGTVARVRAGLQAVGLGIPAGFPDYTLYKMITVMRGGEEVKISKRAGSYVTLRDLIDWTSRDAVRFFLISRKADTEFVFDIDLALKANDENPVFYVQYAHARICSVQRQWIEEIGGWPDVRDKHQGRLRGTLNDLLSDIQSGSMATLPVLRQLAMLLANAALPEDVEQDFPSRLEKIEAQLKRNVIDGLSNRVGKLLFSTEDVKKQTTKLSDELRSSHPGFAEQISSCLEFDGMPRAVASKLFDTLGLSHLEDADCSLLVAPTEQALMRKLAAYPDMLATAAADHAPHDVAFYLRDLAAAFHSYYAAERFLVDDPALARARMALLAAVRQVLRNALQLLGVSAPEAMARDAAPTEVLQ